MSEANEMKKPSTQIGLGLALGAGIGTATGVFAGHIADLAGDRNRHRSRNWKQLSRH